MAERQVLGNAVHVGDVHTSQTAQGTATLGVLGLRQVPATGAGAHDFAARGNLKTLGHGFFGLDAFGTSHNSKSIAKERGI